MPLPIHHLLPLYGLVVTLQFTQATPLNFFHQPALSAFIRHLLGSPEKFDQLIRLDACETGRAFYNAGDYYRFAVYGLNGSENLLQQLMLQLKNLPFSVKKAEQAMPFRDNLKLIAVQDAFSVQTVDSVLQLSAYTETDLQDEMSLWQAMPEFKMHLLSPVRLLKELQFRQNCKEDARFCKQNTDVAADLLSNRLHDHFTALLSKQGFSLPARTQPQPLILSDPTHLFWLNLHYSDSDSTAHTSGGMMGDIFIKVAEPENFDSALWVLGQYTGFGQRSSFGLGRYRLETVAGQCSFQRVFPAHSLLVAVGQESNLSEALAHIQSNVSQDEDENQDSADELILERLQNDMELLHNGCFTPPPLQGFVLEHPMNGIRALAVPPFRDRVLQRAVAQVLQPLVDKLHYQHSYGYRSGRSRLDARYAIQSAWREGYRWVYESDVADFFDSICWSHLAVRLRGLWGDDPVVAALLQWAQAAVVFEGQLIQRRQGLPQGSPLSPVLANIMLDDFDNDMQLAGFRLIRFADDFVVLCKSQEQALQAHEVAKASLAEQGLELNQDKTHIRRMEDGFYYLGYLFVNDMALESPKRLRTTAADQSISKYSWLSQVTARQPKPLNVEDFKARGTTKTPVVPPVLKAEPEKSVEKPDQPDKSVSATEEKTCQVSKTWQVCAVGERDEYGLLLCVTGESCIIRTEEERLQVERGEQVVYDVPWRQLQAVLLLGFHHLTTPALQAAMEFNIAVHFAGQTGKYQGVVWSGQAGTEGTQLWLKQQHVLTHPQFALGLSQAIVGARLFNMRETLRQRGKTGYSEQFDNLIVQVGKTQSLAELNGFEGTGTRWYFSVLKTLLPESFGFNARNRQPPLDPFNSLLSLGFSVLYSCLESVLRCDGLLPWQGFYHQPHGKHATLASDLMEPFRTVVESLALTLINRHQIKFEDFYVTEQGACYLQKEVRNFYLSQLMEKFEEKSVFKLIHQQNLSLVGFIVRGEDFKPWRMR